MASKVSHEGSVNDLIEKARRAAKRVKKISRAAKLNRPKKKRVTTAELIRRAQAKRKAAALRAPVKRRKLPGVSVTKPLVPSLAPIKGITPRPTGGFVPGTEIAWIPVISSNVSDIAHIGEEGDTLWIRFLDGSTYEYQGVPYDVFQRFQSAPSKGKFVWSDIRDQYPYARIA